MNVPGTNTQVNPNTVLIIGALGLAAFVFLGNDDPDVTDIPEPDEPQTLSNSTLAALANRIHAAFWEGWILYEDEEDMMNALLQCNNDTDVWKVVQYYGKRQGPMPGDATLDLFGVYAAALEDDESAAFNEQLRAKGITYYF